MNQPVFYPLFLGIDGGATRSRARLEDAKGALLATAEGGPCNVHRDFDGACLTVESLARACIEHAGLKPSAISETYAGLGLAGLGQHRDREAMAGWPHPFLGISLATDAHVACLAAFGGRTGSVLVVGTGSCAVALVGSRTVRRGGWGFPISDEGSGSWLGLKAVHHALAAYDGTGVADSLSEAVLERFDDDAEEIVAWARTATPADYGTLAPMVVAAAANGLEAATAILVEGGRLLSLLARTVLIDKTDGLAVVGGLSTVMTPYLEPDVLDRVVAPKAPAEAGAVLLAKEHVGYTKALPRTVNDLLEPS